MELPRRRWRGLAVLGPFVRLSLRNLWVNRLRSVLATLGVVLGAASTITMLAIGEGAKRDALAQIERLGATTVYLASVNPEGTKRTQAEQSDSSTAAVARYGLTEQDLRSLRLGLRGVLWIAPMSYREATVLSDLGPLQRCAILGVTPAYQPAQRLRVRRGRFISHSDLEAFATVAVLEAKTAKRLFGGRDPLGRVISFKRSAWKIIGIVDMPDAPAPDSGRPLWTIFIPRTTLKARFGRLTRIEASGSFQSRLVEYDEIVVVCRSVEDTRIAAAMARTILQRNHPEEDYRITVPLELMDQIQAQRRVWNIVLASIAAVSLLVGGIGVMNIMLATVTERTLEIGVRRAVGAKQRDIVFQFLVESTTLTLIGGCLGAALGLVVPAVIEYVTDMSTVVTLPSLLLAVGLSASVGIVFGVYPARRAAQLDPAEALRHGR